MIEPNPATVELARQGKRRAESLEFTDRRFGFPTGWQKYGMVCQTSREADAAKSVGDMVTYHRLMDWIARCQRANANRQRLVRGVASNAGTADTALTKFDDQALIDVLVFEAWGTGNAARTDGVGAELTSRWDTGQGDGVDSGSWLSGDEEFLNGGWEPGDYVAKLDGLSPSRLKELEDGSEPTVEETEACRDIAVAEYFDNNLYSTWQTVRVQSRTGGIAYVAHVLTGDYPCDCSFVGVYRSPAAAIDGLKQRGYVSLEHYRAI